ncbi:MAG: nucleotide pyrophosphohydrolase [Arenicellales bacterium]|jgi:NTP pyrophosphatase (non-canonical NTP hydrolase)|uniref:NTP pyrophosphohydrolase MazG putative catalytic core domain-containing protein n=1 Tax=marine metagenome TaxID=408172 RepID=A0A381WDC0_9ZZZZ|nr:nucleotide pyrophosphohydrolase [Arenicellales bacterium]MDP6393406.1 nucleotide pyrophosphohydrolase [Arenicellales bacterium]MDP7217950.1 nucleotide pyrophosphohydrolase [Arenicellales bacterium]HJP10174.1 nucleotide pyrophosphohydrolase [Arenicellales bacterium]|tara:strand:- start:5161 stop:5607 length:447 start_codon:yes stop_codon:yes gene_type:complete
MRHADGECPGAFRQRPIRLGPINHYQDGHEIMADTFLQQLVEEVNRFVEDRDWQQFHTPKNLSMALSVEAAELVEHFQWLTADQSDDLPRDKRAAVGEELADILIYTIMVAERLGLDLEVATRDKMAQNRRKYPVEKARGLAAKYTEL